AGESAPARPPVSTAPRVQPPPAAPPGAALTPAPPAPPAPPARPCGASSGSRSFDVRTNYTASTGTMSWGDHWFVVSGRLVDTKNYPSTSYTYLHWETNTGSSCNSWVGHEVLLAKAGDGQAQSLNKSVNYGSAQYVRNIWIKS